jgi:hypothetical protein
MAQENSEPTPRLLIQVQKQYFLYIYIFLMGILAGSDSIVRPALHLNEKPWRKPLKSHGSSLRRQPFNLTVFGCTVK